MIEYLNPKPKTQDPKSKVDVSLIVTVCNEAISIGGLMRSVLAQSARPSDIVITDGGSTDGTQEIIRAYSELLPIRLIEMPGANISEGRNAAIREARHDIIVSTDAGVRLHPQWLQSLTEPFELDPDIDVVAGFFVPDPQTPFERAMGATVLPSIEDIDPHAFLPSSRSVAFRKVAWQKVGGYPEWLDYCEDLVFDLALRDLGAKFHFAPGAIAYFRPRPNLKAFAIQYYRYARGDGKANLWAKRHAARYAAYTLGPLLAAWALHRRHTLFGKLALATLLTSAAAYLRRPYSRLLPDLRDLPPQQALYAILMIPLIRLTGDAAKMSGYPVGVAWRLRR